MTLLLGRGSDGIIEMGADGLSISTNLGNQPGRSTLQKLFAAPDRPLAVSLVGANSFIRDGCDCSFAAVVTDFFGWLTTQPLRRTLPELAAALAEQVGSSCKPGESVIWLTGFAAGSTSPVFHRIALRTTKDRRACDQRIDLVSDHEIVDGSGKPSVEHLLLDLYETFCVALARERIIGVPTFGGHWHSLVLRPLGPPTWERPPCAGKLGIDELLGEKALAIADLTVASPQTEIITQMKRLKTELSARTCLANGKQARTIAGIKDKWERGASPLDWQVVHRLVAIGDEASIAAPTDVAAIEAALYSAHVRDLIASLEAPRAVVMSDRQL